MNKLKNNLIAILSTAACMYIAYITGTGEILNYIRFADPLNEMALFGLSSTMAACSLLCIKL